MIFKDSRIDFRSELISDLSLFTCIQYSICTFTWRGGDEVWYCEWQFLWTRGNYTLFKTNKYMYTHTLNWLSSHFSVHYWEIYNWKIPCSFVIKLNTKNTRRRNAWLTVVRCGCNTDRYCDSHDTDRCIVITGFVLVVHMYMYMCKERVY